MLNNVMEDRRGCAIASHRHKWMTRTSVLAVIVGAVALIAAPAAGQPGAAGDKEFQASVIDLSGRSSSITIPLNRSVTVETTVEVARADVVATHIVDVQVISPTRLLFTGQTYGNTSVVLWGKDDKQYVFEVAVELDLDRLNEALRDADPLSNVRASSVRGHIMLSGTASSAERAERMVKLAELFLPVGTGNKASTTIQNHVDVAGEQQVLLRCVIAELKRSALRELGINGFMAGDDFTDAFLVNQLGGINPINIGAAADALADQTIPFLTGEDGIPLGPNTNLSLGFPRVQMQLFIRAMADNSLLAVLAEPNLVAISGETATFLAGGEFPIPVPQGNQQVTIEFREYGVRLNFTPLVKGDQAIRLRIAPEVSELDFSVAVQIEGFVVPGLTSRATETTVELRSGQTIAIAGLLSEQARGLASRVPGIGDVPILGALFRSVNYQRSMTELVVFVTPEMVAPLDAHQIVRLPTDGRTDPSDFELYALGLLDGLEDDEHGKAGDHDAECEGCDQPPALESEPEELSVHGPWGPVGYARGR
jgi:pilus assembly protein CpaC